MSKWLRRGIVLLCCLTLANCSPQTPQTLSFTTLAEEDHSGWEGEATLFVFASSEDIDQVTEFAVPDIQQALAQVNFSTDLALLVLLGKGPSYPTFGVRSVEQQKNHVTIYTHTRSEGTLALDQVGSHYHLIQVSRTGLQGKKLNFNLIFEPEGDLVATVSHHIR